MNEIAEKGYAAHWKYKDPKKIKDNDTKEYKWMHDLLDLMNSSCPHYQNIPAEQSRMETEPTGQSSIKKEEHCGGEEREYCVSMFKQKG